MSRNKRVETLSPTEVASFVADAHEWQQRLISYLTRLRPQNESYVAIVDVVQALERAEMALTGKASDWALGHSTGEVPKSERSNS